MPNIFWVDFSKLDFSEKGGVRKLDLSGHKTYSGDASQSFQPAKEFRFMGL
jgi:choloylglycine hydrolase